MLNDFRHAVRILFNVKGWSLVVILSLALGIGANAALFRALNGVLIRKIPVAHPDSLVRLRWFGKNDMVTASSDYGFSRKTPDGLDTRATFSYPMFEQFRVDNRTMSDLIAGAPQGRANIVVDGNAEIATPRSPRCSSCRAISGRLKSIRSWHCELIEKAAGTEDGSQHLAG